MSTSITINVNDQEEDTMQYRYRLVPKIGPVTTQSRPVPPSSKQHHWHEGEMMFTISITDIQQFTLTPGTAVDKKGNPVTLPAGSFSYAVDNTQMLSITPATDGSSCLVVAVGPLGVGNVTVTYTDSTGNVLASGQAQITVTSSAAVSINLTGSVPVAQP